MDHVFRFFLRAVKRTSGGAAYCRDGCVCFCKAQLCLAREANAGTESDGLEFSFVSFLCFKTKKRKDGKSAMIIKKTNDLFYNKIVLKFVILNFCKPQADSSLWG